jgi:hypothetical protein
MPAGLFVAPFQGSKMIARHISQGDALGFILPALQAGM